jgi:hypothetical protein
VRAGPSSADECRRNAAECERMALLATDPAVREAYADLARGWRVLAGSTEALTQEGRWRSVEKGRSAVQTERP